MSIENPAKRSRAEFITSNKYQEKIILLIFFSSALIFLSFISIIFLGNPAILNPVLHTYFKGIMIAPSLISEAIVFFMCLFLIFTLRKAFIISNNMIGAFARIIRELDEIIAGRSQKIISSRPNDTLTKELLERVNVLVEYYVKHKKNLEG